MASGFGQCKTDLKQRTPAHNSTTRRSRQDKARPLNQSANTTLVALTVPRDAGPDAVERPAELPPPPQMAAGWRSSRSRKLSHGVSDTPAVEPAEKVKPKKRKRVTFVDLEVEQPDPEPTLNLRHPPAEPSTDAGEASWAYPSHTDDDVAAYELFQSNLFERIVAGYSDTADVSQQLRESMSLHTVSAGLMWTDHSQLYVPEHENPRFECFESVHLHPYAGHYGVMRTKKKAEHLYFWPKLAKDIVKWLGSCDPCLRNKAVR